MLLLHLLRSSKEDTENARRYRLRGREESSVRRRDMSGEHRDEEEKRNTKRESASDSTDGSRCHYYVHFLQKLFFNLGNDFQSSTPRETH